MNEKGKMGLIKKLRGRVAIRDPYFAARLPETSEKSKHYARAKIGDRFFMGFSVGFF